MPVVQFKKAPIGWRVGLKPASWHKTQMDAPGDIEFQLSQRDFDRGYRFDTDDPIWVIVDNGSCPAQFSKHQDIDNIRPTGQSVTVSNRRMSGPVRLRYQLNVVRDGARVPIDPIIEN